MNPLLWTAPEVLPPEIDLLVRRWDLPNARIDDVRALLAAQRTGGTACALPTDTSTDANAWGAAARAEAPDMPPTPLVMRQWRDAPYLQAWRYYRAEAVIAEALLKRAQQPAPALGMPLATLLTSLGHDQVNDRQAQAIRCALGHTLALITGGPGTGKTHTLARLLALLIAANPATPPTIKLAAPTGKAAERMREAVEAAADRLPTNFAEGIKAQLKASAAQAATLHRLLGYHPGTGQCTYGADKPLACDLLIVDECSMVDTLMWQALLVALPTGARLVLLGDPHQLESVAAGDVLGALTRTARQAPDSALGQVWVELSESQRFKHRPAIGGLAAAVVNFEPDQASALLHAHTSGAADEGLTWMGETTGHFAWDQLPPVVQEIFGRVADSADPQNALAALNEARLLTAHRAGSLGVSGLNAVLEHHFFARPDQTRAPNQPIIINRNAAELGLTNGSVGVIVETKGSRSAYFPAASATEAPRRFALSQLPDYGPAWAMTIHRSQGSEFAHVVVILPPNESPLATRELIYTGITRAREHIHLWGSESTLRTALTPKATRCTLLEASLGSTVLYCPEDALPTVE